MSFCIYQLELKTGSVLCSAPKADAPGHRCLFNNNEEAKEDCYAYQLQYGHIKESAMSTWSDPKRSETKTTAEKVSKTLDSFKTFLIEKNKRYGDSVLNPKRIFNKEDVLTALRVRIDDKLSRISNAEALKKNDVSDLVGYLILLCVQQGWDDFSELID